eukprot:768246-Hanusia_phi.AAC.1
MEALENNNMDHDKAFSELEEELTSESCWTSLCVEWDGEDMCFCCTLVFDEQLLTIDHGLGCTWTTTTRNKKKSDKSPSKDEQSFKSRGPRSRGIHLTGRPHPCLRCSNSEDKYADKKKNFTKDKSRSPSSAQSKNAHADRPTSVAQSPDSGNGLRRSPGSAQARSQEPEASQHGSESTPTQSPVRSAETNNDSPSLPLRTTPAWSNAAESKSLFAPKPASPEVPSTNQKSSNDENSAKSSDNTPSIEAIDTSIVHVDGQNATSNESLQNDQGEALNDVGGKDENENANISQPNASSRLVTECLSSFGGEHNFLKNAAHPEQVNSSHQDIDQSTAQMQFQKYYSMGMTSSGMGVQNPANPPVDNGVPMYGMGANGIYPSQSRLPQVNGQSRIESYGISRDGQGQMSMKQNAGPQSMQQQMMQQATMLNWQANMMNWNMAQTQMASMFPVQFNYGAMHSQMYGGQPYTQPGAFNGQKGYSNLNKKQPYNANAHNAPQMMQPDMNNFRDMMKMASAAGAYQNGSGPFGYMATSASMYGMDPMGAYGMQGFSTSHGMNGMHESMTQNAVDVKKTRISAVEGCTVATTRSHQVTESLPGTPVAAPGRPAVTDPMTLARTIIRCP